MPSIGIGEIKKATKKFLGKGSLRKNGLAEQKSSLPEQDEELQTAAFINQTLRESQTPQEEGQLSVDIYQTSEQIVIIAPIAGVTMENIHISVTNDVISIQGQRRKISVTPEENYLTKECFWGKFSRSIILPENTNTSKIKAGFKNGILKIVIPKTENVKTKIIQINED